MSEVDVAAVIKAVGVAAVGLQIVRMSRFQNRTKADKTLISVIAEMAFVSPWKQMRVSKPRLSYCDPKQQNGWGVVKIRPPRPKNTFLRCSSVKNLKRISQFSSEVYKTHRCVFPSLNQRSHIWSWITHFLCVWDKPTGITWHNGTGRAKCCVSVFADACLWAASPCKTEACFS